MTGIQFAIARYYHALQLFTKSRALTQAERDSLPLLAELVEGYRQAEEAARNAKPKRQPTLPSRPVTPDTPPQPKAKPKPVPPTPTATFRDLQAREAADRRRMEELNAAIAQEPPEEPRAPRGSLRKQRLDREAARMRERAQHLPVQAKPSPLDWTERREQRAVVEEAERLLAVEGRREAQLLSEAEHTAARRHLLREARLRERIARATA